MDLDQTMNRVKKIVAYLEYTDERNVSLKR